MVLLVAIVRILAEPRHEHTTGMAVAIALPLAALLTLKSTLIPSSILFVFLWGAILAMSTHRVRPILIGAETGVVTFVMLLPWMIVSYQSAGTLLYPFLGEGLRRHTLVVFPHQDVPFAPGVLLKKVAFVATKAQTLIILIGSAMALLLIFLRHISWTRRAAIVAGLMSSIACVCLYAVIFTSGENWRYSYPFAVLGNFIAYGTLLQLLPGSGRWQKLRTATYLLLALPIAFYGVRAVAGSRDLSQIISRAMAGQTAFSPEETAHYRRVQAAIPASYPFLCLLNWPLLFDLTRNRIFYPDNIGSVEPRTRYSLVRNG